MKSKFWTVLLYALAILIILGRIGNAIGSAHPWLAVLKLYPPLSGEMVGADIESLGEDLILFLAIRDVWLIFHERRAAAATR